MKKILAICLSVFMLIGIMPSAFASDAVTISTTEATRIEAENYSINKVATATGESTPANSTTFAVTDDETASPSGAGKFIGNKGTPDLNDTGVSNGKNYVLQLDIPVSVTTAGKYIITPNVYWGGVVNTSHYSVLVDGVKVNSDYLTNTSKSWTRTDVEVNLTADNHTITIEGTGNFVGGNNNNNYITYAVDYVDVAYVPPVVISSTETTRLEAEDYTLYRVTAADKTVRELADTSKFSVAEDETASPAGAGKYNGAKSPTELRTPGTTDGQNYVIQLEVPIKVAEAGTYIITPSVFWDGTASVSAYNLYVDGEKKSTQNLGIADDVWTQTSVSVDLTADDHIITIEGKGNSVPAHYVVFAVDYIDFKLDKPTVPEDVPEEGIIFEAEDYPNIYIYNADSDSYEAIDATSYITADAGVSSGDACLKPSLGELTTKAYYELVLEVEAAGDYVIEARTSQNNKYCLVNGKFSVNGTESSIVSSGAKPEDMAKHLIPATFTKGPNTIRFMGERASNGYFYQYIDYIKIKKDDAVNLSETETKRLEAEDYGAYIVSSSSETAYPIYLSADANLSNGGFIGRTSNETIGSGNHLEYTMKIDVPTSVVYEITPSIYWTGDVNTAYYTLWIDGVQNGEDLAVSAAAWSQPTRTVILDKGSHTVTIKGTGNGRAGNASNYTSFAIDYVDFKPVASGEKDPLAAAKITPPAAVVPGSYVTLSYTYFGTNAEGNSIFRLVYKDGEEWKTSESINTTEGTEAKLEIPESLIGKTIAAEFVPVDVNGTQGDVTHVDLGVLKRDLNLTPYGTFDTEKDALGNLYGRAVETEWVDDGNGGGYLQAINRYDNWEFVTPIDIPVVPGETFDITFDAKVDSGHTNTIGFYSVYKNASGGVSHSFTQGSAVTSEWKTFTLTVTNVATDSNGKDLTSDSWTAGIRLLTEPNKHNLYIDNLVVRPRLDVEYDWDNYYNERWGEMEALDTDDGFVDEIAEDGTAYKAFYVDGSSGSDSNDGLTEGTPLKSIAKAKELVQPYLADMTGHIYVYIKGSHNLTETITWGVDDSGQNGYNVIYTKWGDSQPEITMKEDFSGFTLHDSEKNIWKVYVGTNNPARQVYINDVRGVRARTDTPESQKDLLINPERIGDLYSTECGYLCGNMEFANFTNQEDIELVFTEQWTSKRGKVKQIYKVNDKTVRIDLQDESWQHVVGSATKNIDPGSPTWIENAYELLDAKGEWYINKKDGYLYYIPRDFENPETMVATIPVGEHAFIIAGNSVDEKVHNIVFDNLAIKYTTWLHPNLYGVNDSQNNFLDLYEGDGRLTGGKEDGAVIIADAAFVDIRNCTFAHMGGGGIFYREVFQGCEVTGNHIYDMSGTAVNMGLTTWENKDPYKYIRTTKYKNYLINNKINNNLIHDVGVEYRSASAVSVSYVINTEIKNNEIYNSSYSAIHLGGGMDTTSYGRITALQGVEVMYNYVHDIMNDLVYDGGCFYAFGHCGGECTVAYNYFENQRNWYAPLYFDTGTDKWQVHNNVIDLAEVPTWAGGNRVGERKTSGWIANGPFFGLSEDAGSVYDNYSTTDKVTVATPGTTTHEKYEAPALYESGAWPSEALSIIDNAGLESEYTAKYGDSVQRIRVLNEEQEYYFLDTGDTLTLDVTGYYRKLNEASDVAVSFYSSNEDVATVNSNGVITAVGNGKCGIYAEAIDGEVVRRQNINVVVDDSVKEIKCNTSVVSLFTGNTFDLKITAETQYGQTVTITPTVTFDTAGIATVSNGVLTAAAEGNTVAHVTYTSGDVTLTKDIPVYVVSGYNRGSTTTAYTNSSTKIASGADFLNAANWTGNVTTSGTGLSVKGTTHNYMPAYYKNKLSGLVSFNMTINNPMSWPSIFLKAKDLSKGYEDGYMITFKENKVELHRFENGERTTIFGESMYNPIGNVGFTNNSIYSYGSKVNITVGTIDEDDGVRVILVVGNNAVFDYLDREAEYLKGDGYLGVYEWSGNFTVAPYNTSFWPF